MAIQHVTVFPYAGPYPIAVGGLVAINEHGHAVPASTSTGKYRRGHEVVLRWVGGWKLPFEVDGRRAKVTVDDQQPRRVGLVIDGLPGCWWAPPSALRPVDQQPLMRWAGIKPGRPWELR